MCHLKHPLKALDTIGKHCIYLCSKGVISFNFLLCNFRNQLSSNFHRFSICCNYTIHVCWDISSKNTGHWQLQKVSSAFKESSLSCQNNISNKNTSQ